MTTVSWTIGEHSTHLANEKQTKLILNWISWRKTVWLNKLEIEMFLTIELTIKMLNWIVWNRTDYLYKKGFGIILATEVDMPYNPIIQPTIVVHNDNKFGYVIMSLVILILVSLFNRVFANGPGNWGSVPGRVIPKTLKVVLDTSLLNTAL